MFLIILVILAAWWCTVKWQHAHALHWCWMPYIPSLDSAIVSLSLCCTKCECSHQCDETWCNSIHWWNGSTIVCMLLLFNLDCMISLWHLSSPMNIRVHTVLWKVVSASLPSTVCRPKEDSDQGAAPTTPIQRAGVWRAVCRPHVDCRMACRERLECAWDQAPGESVTPPWSKCSALWHRGVWVMLVYTISYVSEMSAVFTNKRQSSKQ